MTEARPNRIPARIGLLFFKYEDPDVTVDTASRTVNQETIDGSIVVQQFGREPDSITVDTIVADHELQFIDDLVKQGVISLRTNRWSGDVIVENTNSTFMRAKDDDQNWLHEVTIECLEVEEGLEDEGAVGGGGVGGGIITIQ